MKTEQEIEKLAEEKRQELVKAAEDYCKKRVYPQLASPSVNSNLWVKMTDFYNGALFGYKAASQAHENGMRWVKCSERLPKKDLKVFCLHEDSGNRFVSWYTNDCNTGEEKWYEGAQPTHWLDEKEVKKIDFDSPEIKKIIDETIKEQESILERKDIEPEQLNRIYTEQDQQHENGVDWQEFRTDFYGKFYIAGKINEKYSPAEIFYWIRDWFKSKLRNESFAGKEQGFTKEQMLRCYEVGMRRGMRLGDGAVDILGDAEFYLNTLSPKSNQ